MTDAEWKRVIEEYREAWRTRIWTGPEDNDFHAGQQSGAISSADYFLRVLLEGMVFHETSMAYMRKQRSER